MGRSAKVSKVKVSLVKGDTAVDPLVVNFPNGVPTSSTLAGDDSDTSLNFVCHRNTAAKREYQKIVSASKGTVSYMGKNFGEFSQRKNQVKYAVGVLDRKAGTLKLAQVSHVYPLRQTIAGLDDDDSDDGVITDTPLAQRRMLIETFGSKKKARSMKAGIAAAVGTDNVKVKGAIFNTLSEVAQSQPSQEAIDALRDSSRNIPPFNKDAESLEDIYDIRGIISQEDWDSLEFKDLLKASKKTATIKELEQTKQYPVFLTNMLHNVNAEAERHDKIKLVKCLLYWTYILRFTKAPNSKLSKDDELMEFLDAPHSVCETIRGTFAQQSKSKTGRITYARTPLLKDKAITYMAVLALIVNKFSMSPDAMAAALKITPLRSLLYFKEVGCKVDRARTKPKGESGYTIKLTLPLTFPAKPRIQRK